MKDPFAPAQQARRLMKLLLYGGAGVGKTVLALTIPYGGKVALLDLEDGSNFYGHSSSIPAFNVLRTRSYREITQALDYLAHDKHDYGAVVVDPISVLWNVIVDAGSDLDKATSMRQWGMIKRKMDGIYRQIVGLPVNVTVIARSKDEYKGDEKVGEKADAEKNLPFLFDVVLHLNVTSDGKRWASVTKDRTNTLGRRVDNLTPDIFAPILHTTSQGVQYTALDEEQAISELHRDMEREEQTPRNARQAQAKPQTPHQRFTSLQNWMAKQAGEFPEGTIVNQGLVLSQMEQICSEYEAIGADFIEALFPHGDLTIEILYALSMWLDLPTERKEGHIRNWQALSSGVQAQ